MGSLGEKLKPKYKVYSGDNIIKRVLEQLEVAKEIASNPYVIEKVSIIVCELIEQRNIRIEGIKTNWNVLKGECTEEQISQILNLLKSITYELGKGESELDEPREGEPEPDQNKNENEAKGNRLGYSVKYEITVELKGRFSIKQQISLPSGCDETIITTFGFDPRDTGAIIENISRTKGFQINSIDPSGIVMQRRWREEDGRMAEMIRMKQDPIIAIVKYQQETSYHSMTMEELPNMMGSTKNFLHGQMRTTGICKSGKATYEEAQGTPEYQATLSAITGLPERKARFFPAIKEMCEKAGLEVSNRNREE